MQPNKNVNTSIDASEMTEKLFWHIRGKFRTNKIAAQHYGVSSPLLSLVLKGERSPNEKMLSDIGLKKVVEKKVSVKYVSINEKDES